MDVSGDVGGMVEVLGNVGQPIRELVVLAVHMSELDGDWEATGQLPDTGHLIVELLGGLVLPVTKPHNEFRVP